MTPTAAAGNDFLDEAERLMDGGLDQQAASMMTAHALAGGEAVDLYAALDFMDDLVASHDVPHTYMQHSLADTDTL